jgi:hypothetical protein
MKNCRVRVEHASWLVQVLGLSFRARELTLVAAGMSPVKVTGVENVDLRSLVSVHTDYAANMTAILELLGLAEVSKG